jgi:hypothetical protein
MLLAPASADDEWDKVLLLQKVKRHIAEGVKRLPDYTCLQTTGRYRRKAGEKEQERRVDTLVLEVLNAGEKELYAAPGARSFQADGPDAFTGHGLTGTGSFGLFLSTLFVNDHGMFQYRGEEQFRGRRAVKWDYRVPVTSSGYTMRLQYSQGRVGMRGSVVVDAQTLDLLHLTVVASEIPPNLPLASATQTMEYALTRIGDRDVMLPQSASMKVVDDDGAHSRNEVDFTHCQSFRVESTLSFNTPADGPVTTSLPPEEARPIPEGLMVTIELAMPVSETLPVGTSIEARVAADVRDRGRIAIPGGTRVRGRLRRLEREGEYWALGLEFTEIETAAGPARFYANVQDLDKQGGSQFLLVRGKGQTEVFLPYLPGVAQFYAPQLPLPKGFKTVWKTTSPRSANR